MRPLLSIHDFPSNVLQLAITLLRVPNESMTTRKLDWLLLVNGRRISRESAGGSSLVLLCRISDLSRILFSS